MLDVDEPGDDRTEGHQLAVHEVGESGGAEDERQADGGDGDDQPEAEPGEAELEEALEPGGRRRGCGPRGRGCTVRLWPASTATVDLTVLVLELHALGQGVGVEQDDVGAGLRKPITNTPSASLSPVPTSAPFGLVTVTTAPSTGTSSARSRVPFWSMSVPRTDCSGSGSWPWAAGARPATSASPIANATRRRSCPTDRHHDGPGHYSGMDSREVSTRLTPIWSSTTPSSSTMPV